jgi:VanZ family protein
VLWAVADEVHQAFTATRGASVRDVALDTGGAALGLLLVWRVRSWR